MKSVSIACLWIANEKSFERSCFLTSRVTRPSILRYVAYALGYLGGKWLSLDIWSWYVFISRCDRSLVTHRLKDIKRMHHKSCKEASGIQSLKGQNFAKPGNLPSPILLLVGVNVHKPTIYTFLAVISLLSPTYTPSSRNTQISFPTDPPTNLSIPWWRRIPMVILRLPYCWDISI